MSVKSDRWIRQMASEKGMIEPFEPGQIKEANGERVVSFGTSSYGYDIRCSGEFKIFTNINSMVPNVVIDWCLVILHATNAGRRRR